MKNQDKERLAEEVRLENERRQQNANEIDRSFIAFVYTRYDNIVDYIYRIRTELLLLFD